MQTSTLDRPALLLTAILAGCGGNVFVSPAGGTTGNNGGASGSATLAGGAGSGVAGSENTAAGSGGSPTGAGPDLPPAQDEGMALVQQLCPQVAAEKHFCVSSSAQAQDVGFPLVIFAIGLDTHSTCVMGEFENQTDDSASIAVVGNYLYRCDGKVWRVPLSGGTVEYFDVDCDGIVAYGDHFLVVPFELSPEIHHYESLDALKAGAPLETLVLDAPGRTYATQKDTLWTCDNPPKVLRAYDLPGGAAAGTVAASGVEPTSWLLGLDASDDGLIFLNSFWGLLTIDAASGTLLDESKPDPPGDMHVRSLHCWTNP
jgi:hypothetical protein